MRSLLSRSLKITSAVLFLSAFLFSQSPSDLVSQIAALNHHLLTHPFSQRPGEAPSTDIQLLLESRRKLIEQLIRTDPGAVRPIMLPTDVAEQLRATSPAYIAAIETDGHWTGTLEATIADDFEHGRSTTHWYVHSGDQRIELFFAIHQNPMQHVHRMVIVDGVGTSNVISVESLRSASPELQAPAGLNCNPTGSESVAVLIMKQPNGGTPYPDPTFATSAYWQPIYLGASAPSVNHFWGETSFSTTSLSGNFFGPLTFDANYDCNTTEQMVTSAIAAAKASGQDLSTFSRISIIYPVAACGFGGLGDVGCRAPDSNLNHPYSITWIPVISYYTTSQVLWGLIAHELGHNLGLNHSSSLDFGTIPLGALDYTEVSGDQNPNAQGDSGTGVAIEYGDPYTMMGGGTYSCFGQYTAFNKSEYLGWTTRTTDTKELTTSGGSFKVLPFENSTGLRALRILRDPLSSSWIWIEYRQPLGNYDSQLDDLTCEGGTSNVLSGANIYYESPHSSDGHLYLLDMNPTGSPNDFSNGALTPSHSWSDPNSLITLSVTGADSTGLSISANYDAPCATLQISNGGVFNSGGGAGTITVTAPSNCSWTATTVDSWITINSGSSGNGSGTVSFTVAANGNGFQRPGYITVQRQSVALSQKGSATFISNLNPIFQSGLSGIPLFTFNDPSGTSDINYVTTKIHDRDCFVETLQSSGNWFMFLLDPVTNQFSSAVSPGQNQSASNLNCTLNGLTSTVNMNGNQFQLGVSLTFAQSFVGSYRVTGSVCDGLGGNNCSSDISIGTWQVGSTSPAITSVTPNSGKQGATLPIVIVGSNTHFSGASTVSVSGTGVAVSGISSPSATQINATFTIDPNATASARTLTVTTGGEVVTSTFTVVASGQVKFSVGGLTFGPQNAFSTSAPQTPTLANVGHAPLNISSITATAEFGVTHNCGTSLGVGASCTLTVTFKPTHLGVRTGSVVVSDDSPGAPHLLSLSGTGQMILQLSRPSRGHRPNVLPVGLSRRFDLKLDARLTSGLNNLSCVAPQNLACTLTTSSSGILGLTVNAEQARPGRYTLLIVAPDSSTPAASVPVEVKPKRRRHRRKL